MDKVAEDVKALAELIKELSEQIGTEYLAAYYVDGNVSISTKSRDKSKTYDNYFLSDIGFSEL